jgi:hypothetical protein
LAAPSIDRPSAVDPGEQLLEYLDRLPLVIGVGPGYIPCPQCTVEVDQPGDAVTAEVARPQIALLVRMPREASAAVRP